MSAPRRWLVCTKDRFWSSLPKEPAPFPSILSPSPQHMSSVELFTKHVVFYPHSFMLYHAPSRTDRSTRVSVAAGRGYQPDITPRGYTNRQLAPRAHLFPYLVPCLTHVGTTIYIAVSERTQMSRHAELLSAQRRATVKPCLYNHLVYHRLKIPIRSKRPLRKRPRCLVLGLDPPWGGSPLDEKSDSDE